jgi:hypothetical protein
VVWSWTPDEEKAVMGRLEVVHEQLRAEGKLGPALRLFPTTSATTLHKGQAPPLVVDGPFAETKEQLLGFYVIDVEDLETAVDVARRLSGCRTGSTYEIRPIALFNPDPRPNAHELALTRP